MYVIPIVLDSVQIFSQPDRINGHGLQWNCVQVQYKISAYFIFALIELID